MYDKALALSKVGQQDEAIKFFNKALEYDPSMSMVVLIDLSVILENLGRYKEVIDVYKRLQDIHWPISYRFKDKEGYAHYKMGDLEKAIEIVDDTLALNPHFANALYNKSVYLSRKGEIEDSISCLKKAIELDKTYMDNAKTDKDLDPIRKDARFIKLVSTVE